MEKTTDKKRLGEKVEEALTRVAYAEGGELYSAKQLEKEKKEGKKGVTVCVKGETPSGLCV